MLTLPIFDLSDAEFWIEEHEQWIALSAQQLLLLLNPDSQFTVDCCASQLQPAFLACIVWLVSSQPLQQVHSIFINSLARSCTEYRSISSQQLATTTHNYRSAEKKLEVAKWGVFSHCLLKISSYTATISQRLLVSCQNIIQVIVHNDTTSVLGPSQLAK